MSTRAVYKFLPSGVSVYVHYDGYFEGAAEKFAAALDCPNRRGQLLEKFIRTEENAEVTTSAGDHGDLEFIYQIDETKNVPMLTAWELRDWEAYKFEIAYTGPLKDFLEKHLKKPFVYCRGTLMSFEAAMELMEKVRGQVSHWIERDAVGNASGVVGDLWRMCREVSKSLSMTLIGTFHLDKLDEFVEFIGAQTPVLMKGRGWEKYTPEAYNRRMYEGWEDV